MQLFAINIGILIHNLKFHVLRDPGIPTDQLSLAFGEWFTEDV